MGLFNSLFGNVFSTFSNSEMQSYEYTPSIFLYDFETKYMPIVHSNTIQITPITGRKNIIPEATNTRQHF